MALDITKRSVLAAHIRANTDADVVAALAARNDTEITRLYNLVSSFWVWKPSVGVEDYRKSLVWVEVDTLNAGKARIWEWVTGNMTLPIKADDPNVRAGIAETFASNTQTRANLLAIAKRLATLAESVFGTGVGTEQNPGTLTFHGQITTTDVGRALNENP